MCSIEGCEKENYADSDKCIFHCEKEDWYEEINDEKEEKKNKKWDKDKVNDFWKCWKEYLEDNEKDFKEKESTQLQFDMFNNFIFPKTPSYKYFMNYHFNIKLVFNSTCKFLGDISFSSLTFMNTLHFDGCSIKGNVYLNDFKLEGKLIFNNMKINKLDLSYSTFSKKVELKGLVIEDIDLQNTTFNSFCDFYETEFNKTNFEKTDFNDLSGFTNAIFNKDVNFKYTTFNNLAIFRKSIFKKNLNLEDSIFNRNPNFFGVSSKKGIEEDIKVSNRETARIIKDSFEQQNNIIDANKFYALEMQKKDSELDVFKNPFQKFVFFFHSISSNHSQDWFLVLFWLFISTFIYSCYTITEIIDKCKYLPCAVQCIHYDNLFNNTQLEHINLITNSLLIIVIIGIPHLILAKIEGEKILHSVLLLVLMVSYSLYTFITNDYLLIHFSNVLNPFSILTSKDIITFSLIVYKVIIAYLIYQFIVSIRQNTRRK